MTHQTTRSAKLTDSAKPIPRKLSFNPSKPATYAAGKLTLLTDFLGWDQTIRDARKTLETIRHG